MPEAPENQPDQTPNTFAEEAAKALASFLPAPASGGLEVARGSLLSRWTHRPLRSPQTEWGPDDEEPLYEPDEQPGRPRRAWPWLLLTVIIVAVAVSAYFVVTNRGTSAGPQFSLVPKVVGLPEAKAVAKLKAAGFECTIDARQRSVDVQEGVVMSQDADGGAKLQKGMTVGLVVSSGNGQVIVPDVVGLTQAEAEDKLSEVGLEAVAKPEVASNVAVGKVARQNPEAKKRVDPGTSVTITVSSITNTVQVPPFTGIAQETAVAVLKSMGLVPAVQPVKSQLAGGLVDHQDPASGSEVTPGATVKLFVSNSPAKKTVFVPAVGALGLTETEARAILAKFGLKARVIDLQTPDSKPGLCIYQDPAAGAEVKIGSVVDITIARRPTTTTTTAPVGPPAPTGATRYDQTHKHIAKTGSWADYSVSSAYWSSYGRSSTPGASATINFSGTRLDWIAMRGTTTGVAIVYLDGAKKATVNLAAPSARYQQDVWSTGNLARGSHKVTIVLSSTSPAGKFLTLDAVDIWGAIK